MIDDELLKEMTADAEALAIPDDNKLRIVGTLADQLLQLQAQVAQQELTLEETKAALAKVAQLDLPEALSQAGLAEIKLPDGTRVTVGDEYYANIPSPDSDEPELVARRRAAFTWLREHNHGDLIKQEVKLAFSRGQDALAKRTMNGLDKAGIPYNNTEQVHHSTLKAFVREQVENGQPLPLDTFGVCIKRVAKVKRTK